MEKKPWLSKSMWFGLLTGLSPFLVALLGFDLSQLLADKGSEITMIWGAIAIILRLVTKEKIKLVD